MASKTGWIPKAFLCVGILLTVPSLAAHRTSRTSPHTLDLAPPHSALLADSARSSARDPQSLGEAPPAASLRLREAVHLQWATPPLEALAHNFHRQGLPIVHLWETPQSLMTLGLNRRGVPGLYLLKKVP